MLRWWFIGTMSLYVLVNKGVYRDRELQPTWLFAVLGCGLVAMWLGFALRAHRHGSA